MDKEDFLAFSAMALTLILIFFATTGCAEPFPNDNPDEPAVTCEAQLLPVNLLYPDGQTRKSHIALCSDGCTRVSDVSDPAIAFTSCQ